MRKPLSLLFLFSFIISGLFAQKVQVIDAQSGKPVANALIISKEFTTQTNEQGLFKLDAFKENSSLLIQHSSYLKKTLTKDKIRLSNFLIRLIEDPVRLEEVVVSVNRWEQSKTEIPNTVKIIRQEEILLKNQQNTADLLGSKSGVFIQKSQMGGGSPMIRGFSANSLLIVVDGVRMNNAIYRSGNLHNVISVDALSLESAEIIYGPGSVIYGSDALGGVMSFNTLTPKLSTSENEKHSGKVFSRWSSANFEKTIHGTYSFGSESWAGLISSTYTDFDDLRIGSHGPEDYLRHEYVNPDIFNGADQIVKNKDPQVMKPSGYSQLNLLSKLRYRKGDELDVILSAHHSETSDMPRYDRLVVYRNDILQYAGWHYGPQKWSLFSTQVKHLKEYKLFDKLNLLAAYQFYTESRHDRKFNSPIQNNRKENLDVISVNLDLAKNFNKQNQLFYGLEALHNYVHSSGFAKNIHTEEDQSIAPRYPDGSIYQSLAAYYSYKFLLNERFVFQAGSRFTVTHLEGDFENVFYHFPFDRFDMQNSAFNGNVGMVWHPTAEWQINLNASSGFRSPNIDDIAKVFDSEPGNVIVPNPELKPEYARNIEAQIIRSYSNKAKIEIAAFYSRLKDAMVRRDFILNGKDSIMYDGIKSNVEALVNAESAWIAGATFTFEYLFTNSLRMQHDLTVIEGKDSDDYPVRHVPPTFGTSRFIFDNQQFVVDLYLDYNGRIDFEELAPSEKDKPHMYVKNEQGNPYSPSWWTLNLKSSWKFSKNYRVNAGIENIFDRRYAPYSSGIAAPGVNFIVSAQVSF